MKIYQIVTTLGYGDAVGNNIIALMDALRKSGYQTKVFAEAIDSRIAIADVESLNRMPCLQPQDIIIYHLATGAELNFKIAEFPCKKILVYHNITPPHFFRKYNIQASDNCQQGLESARFLVDKVNYCLADSSFNKDDLLQLGYQCKVDVLPILLDFKEYQKEIDGNIIKQLEDGYENVLFVGRIAPNKKHEDIIAAFAVYKKYYNPKARLILAGSYSGMEVYWNYLKAYIMQNSIEDVIFTGHINMQGLLAYYHSARIFLCMSEHEGFCVPLVEAMYFDVPIVAYDSTAVGDTLGGAGILLKEKNPLVTAAWMNRVSKNNELRKNIIDNQRERLRDFSEEKIKGSFLEYMKEFMGG